ncbi:putative protein phosphatase 2C 33 [Drosera capensis]
MVAVTDLSTRSSGWYRDAPLECIINVIRALRMGSCLSAESRSPLPGSPSALGVKKNYSSKRRYGSKSALDNKKDDHLQRIPGRRCLNGATESASLFTKQGKKGTNQDAMIVWENFGSRHDTIFCGVFDGHGPFGHMVSKRVRDSLPQKLSMQWEVNAKSEEVLREISLNINSMNPENTSSAPVDEEPRVSVDLQETEKHPELFQMLKETFLKAFKVMDRELNHASIDCFCSGTTAVTLVKQGQCLVIGNIGDSRAVLGMRDEKNSLHAVQLTVDLKPNLPAEAQRIRKRRGRVFALRDEPEVARVWMPNSDTPGLAMARAFGDFCLKDFGLISVPDVSYHHLSEKDEFVVLATDGIWDVLSNEEVVDIVASAPLRSHAARALVETAVSAWRFKYPAIKTDDCAAVCLFLDSAKSCISSASHAGEKDQAAELVGSAKDEKDTVDLTKLDHHSTNTHGSPNDPSAEKDPLIEPGIDWSALEGVSRVNTFVKLAKFVPGQEDKKSP